MILTTTRDRVRELINLLRTRSMDHPEVEEFIETNQDDLRFMVHVQTARRLAIQDGVMRTLLLCEN